MLKKTGVQELLVDVRKRPRTHWNWVSEPSLGGVRELKCARMTLAHETLWFLKRNDTRGVEEE